MPHPKEANLVRFNLFLPEGERDAFDDRCRRGGKPRLSMSAAARELFRLYAAGKVEIDRDGALKRSRTIGRPPKPAEKPQVKGPRNSPVPPRRRGK